MRDEKSSVVSKIRLYKRKTLRPPTTMDVPLFDRATSWPIYLSAVLPRTCAANSTSTHLTGPLGAAKILGIKDGAGDCDRVNNGNEDGTRDRNRAKEGNKDEIKEGTLLGEDEGTDNGNEDGIKEGTLFGEDEGINDGNEDEIKEGTLLGADDGKEDGNKEGTLLGTIPHLHHQQLCSSPLQHPLLWSSQGRWWSLSTAGRQTAH